MRHQLKENNLLLQHVAIPGYVHAFNNRDRLRGGGVDIYTSKNPLSSRGDMISRNVIPLWNISGYKFLDATGTANSYLAPSMKHNKILDLVGLHGKNKYNCSICFVDMLIYSYGLCLGFLWRNIRSMQVRSSLML